MELLDDGVGGLILSKSISVEKNVFVAGTNFIFRENKNGARSRCRLFSRILLETLSRIFLVLPRGKLDNFPFRERFSGAQKYTCRVEEGTFPVTIFRGAPYFRGLDSSPLFPSVPYSVSLKRV